MRVVGGALRGRTFDGPSTRAIRPTSERLRESAFDILTHVHGEPREGARVLDLFAGTGALGIEALSRGAAFALFVDSGAEALSLVKRNLDRLKLNAVSAVARGDATRLDAGRRHPAFTLAFLDPPYGADLGGRALSSLADVDWLAADALVVVEDHSKSKIEPPDSFQAIDSRVWGDTGMWFFRFRRGRTD
jgi:16S rRNA (guanine966-N2)-methyltransferase